MGSAGALVAGDHSTQVTHLPEEQFADEETAAPQNMGRSHGIYRDWINACRGEPAPILADFHHGGTLSELLMLGNIATLFPGETLTYQVARVPLTGPSGAAEQLAYDYRAGWSL